MGQTVTLLANGDGSAAHLVTGRVDGLNMANNGTSVHPVQQVTAYAIAAAHSPTTAQVVYYSTK